MESDIEFLNDLSIKNNGKIYVHKLYYNKFAEQKIIDYSKRAEKEFEEIVYYLKINDHKLKNISERIYFSPSSEIYAWRWRKEIKKLLQICVGTEDEVVFCSTGVYETIKNLVKGQTRVVPIETCFGGNIDLSLGLTAKSIVSKIREMQENNIKIKEIYLPHIILCIEGKYDLNCDTIDLIKKTYPQIKVNLIQISTDFLVSTVKLDHCVHYFIDKSKHDKQINDRPSLYDGQRKN